MTLQKLLTIVLMVLNVVITHPQELHREKMTYIYYPNYNIVRCTQNNIFNLSYQVQKVSPHTAQGTILGYVSYKEDHEAQKQDYALILNRTQSNIIFVDIAHHASGLLHGSGIPVSPQLQKEDASNI